MLKIKGEIICNIFTHKQYFGPAVLIGERRTCRRFESVEYCTVFANKLYVHVRTVEC